MINQTEKLNQAIDQLIENNSDQIDNLAEIFTNPDGISGADNLISDLEEYSFADIQHYVDPNHPLHELMGSIAFGKFVAEGILLVHEDSNRIPLYALIYMDENEQLRGLVPTDGNAFNPLNGKPYGEGGFEHFGDEIDSSLDRDDETIAQQFGYKSYDAMLHDLTVARSTIYNKDEIKEYITSTFKTEIENNQE